MGSRVGGGLDGIPVGGVDEVCGVRPTITPTPMWDPGLASNAVPGVQPGIPPSFSGLFMGVQNSGKP